MFHRSLRSRFAAGGALVLIIVGGSAALVPQKPEAAALVPAAHAPGPATVRRLSADQYRNIIHDVFGRSLDLGGYFEPDLRISGLLAVGSGKVGITPAGMEQYDAMARSIAGQVADEDHRAQMIPCAPKSADAADDACAGAFLARVGRLLYRRPLSEDQLEAYVDAAAIAARTTGDFYQGIEFSLAAMLSSPQFLFREARTVPARGSVHVLDAYAKASQLSFFLWNSGPDLLLLEAAAKGVLDRPRGLSREVDRMMESPRLEAGLRAFFTDNFGFDKITSLTKDAAIFPEFSAQVAEDAQEQTLRTILDVVLTRNADYREIFTTKKTFLTQQLGSIYRVPAISDAPNGAPDTWQEYEFAADDPRAGILTHISFTALHSPAGRGSPTLRGKALREIMMCQPVPPPPGDVPFNIINDTSNPLYRTARKRLAAHAANPVCAGCHKITDPIGLALETFDGQGKFRTTENRETLDTSGTLDGVAYQDAAGLARAVRDNPATTTCIVNRLSAYALGRATAPGEKAWVAHLQKAFADGGYRATTLMRAIAVSREFYTVSPPALEQSASAPASTGETR